MSLVEGVLAQTERCPGGPRSGLSLVMLGAAFFGVGCSGPPQAAFPSAGALLGRLSDATSCSRAVSGEANLAFSGDGRRLRGKILYLAAAPDRLRLDVFSPFGVTLSTLTSDGSRFGLYNLDERTFLYGPALTCNVQRFTQVPVPASALVELLRGRAPVLRHQASSLSYKRQLFSNGHYVVRLQGEHESTEELLIGIHPDDFSLPLARQRPRLLGVTVTQAGQVLYDVELSRHEERRRKEQKLTSDEREMGIVPMPPSGPECDAELPSRVKFHVPETGYQLTFDNVELAHNPQLAEGAFRQQIPNGVSAQESLCQDYSSEAP